MSCIWLSTSDLISHRILFPFQIRTWTLKRLSISIATNLQFDNSTRICLGFFRAFLRSWAETADGLFNHSRLLQVLNGGYGARFMATSRSEKESCVSNHSLLKYSNTRHCIWRVWIVPCPYLFLELKRFCWFTTVQNKNFIKFSYWHCLSSIRSYTRTQTTGKSFSTRKNTWHEGRLNSVTLTVQHCTLGTSCDVMIMRWLLYVAIFKNTYLSLATSLQWIKGDVWCELLFNSWRVAPTYIDQYYMKVSPR